MFLQMQKQLELIRSVCDSMLPQPSTTQTNVHQLRNNLTPSPIYSELRQFSSPNPHSMNALNVVNPQADNTWHAGSGQPNVSFPDAANYQNWLTTNTLQTQAFMLNSLNQCCQMLWLQQRELTNLRGMITAVCVFSIVFNVDNVIKFRILRRELSLNDWVRVSSIWL